MQSWFRMRGTTIAAILIALILTVSFGYIAVESILGALDPDRLGANFGRGVLSAAPAGTTSDAGAAAANASVFIVASDPIEETAVERVTCANGHSHPDRVGFDVEWV